MSKMTFFQYEIGKPIIEKKWKQMVDATSKDEDGASMMSMVLIAFSNQPHLVKEAPPEVFLHILDLAKLAHSECLLRASQPPSSQPKPEPVKPEAPIPEAPKPEAVKSIHTFLSTVIGISRWKEENPGSWVNIRSGGDLGESIGVQCIHPDGRSSGYYFRTPVDPIMAEKIMTSLFDGS